MTSHVHLCLVLHNHQPIGNFDGVFEQAYQDSYLPFLDVFEPYEQLQISLHTSGPLMLWLAERHPEYLDRIRMLVDVGRIEIIGEDNTANGDPPPLSNTSAEPFNDGVNFSQEFRLDLGAEVVSVVPQPVNRNTQRIVDDEVAGRRHRGRGDPRRLLDLGFQVPPIDFGSDGVAEEDQRR